VLWVLRGWGFVVPCSAVWVHGCIWLRCTVHMCWREVLSCLFLMQILNGSLNAFFYLPLLLLLLLLLPCRPVCCW
jgi:heme A synthase